MNACDLIEMKIAANDPQIVLTRQRGDPQIVFWNRPALPPQFVAKARIMKRRIQVDCKNARSRDQQGQQRSEALPPVRSRQAVSILTNDDGGKMMVFFEGEKFGNRLIAGEER
jgi:hypothetical protein